MAGNADSEAGVIKDRLFSLDFFRGLTMFLLIGETWDPRRAAIVPLAV